MLYVAVTKVFGLNAGGWAAHPIFKPSWEILFGFVDQEQIDSCLSKMFLFGAGCTIDIPHAKRRQITKSALGSHL